MKILIKALKGIFWVVYAWQIFGLIPVLTWVNDLSAVTPKMWFTAALKLTVLIACYALYRFFDKKYKSIPIKPSKESSSIVTSIPKIPKGYAIIAASSVAMFLVVFIILRNLGASTYEDCILKNVKSSMSNSAMGAVKKACNHKFPLKITKNSQEFIDFQKEKADRYNNTGLSFMNYMSSEDEKRKRDNEDFEEFIELLKSQR